MAVEEWVEQVSSAEAARDRIAHALPTLQALRAPWEAVWQELWSGEEDAAEDLERGIAVGRHGIAMLERYVAGTEAEAPIDDEALRSLCQASDAVAVEVGENGQQLDDFEDAGFAHAFTALLTACLHEALGEPHPERTCEEVAEGMRFLVESCPSLESAFP